MKRLGLYIHLPFCNHICTYCDFLKRVSSDEIKEKYFKALFNELDSRKCLFDQHFVRTIYIGGGTPSSIKLPLLEKFFKKLASYFDLARLEEFTFECNIEDITIDLVRILTKYHINRVSIGIESLNSRVLTVIGRMCNYSDICQKMQILREFGLKNVNFDYIYGIEPMTLEDTINDLKALISLKPTHISCYSLILEEKTILYHQYQKGTFKLMDEDKETMIYQEIVNFLENNGYLHYEISNFAISGYESKHNIIYWSNEEYLGIGLGSSSYLGNYRFHNSRSLTKYLEFYQTIVQSKHELNDLSIVDEKLSIKEKAEYHLILGLRLVNGINLTNFFNVYHQSIFDYYPAINRLIEQNYLEKKDDNLRINPKYLYLQNQILLKILK